MDKNINYNKQCLGLLGHLALGQPAGQGKAICSSQTLQPQGSLSGVQALDLMKVNQIRDVSDKTFGGHISVFFNETTFHNNISDQPYCQEQFFLFLPLLPLCFYSPWTPCPPLFYCSSFSLPFFLCFFNLLKVFFISPQSQTRSTFVSFCPQTLYLFSETKQSFSCQVISSFFLHRGKTFVSDMNSFNFILDSAAKIVTISI